MEGKGNRRRALYRRDPGTRRKRTAEDLTFELIQGVGTRQPHARGKGSALPTAGHSPRVVRAGKSPCPKTFVVE